MLVSKQVTVAIDFHTRGRNNMEVNLLMNNIVQNILFCVKQKILTHTQVWKNLTVSKWEQKYHFWVNCYF